MSYQYLWDIFLSFVPTILLQKLKFRVIVIGQLIISRFNGKRFNDLRIRKSVSINVEIPSLILYSNESNGTETIRTGLNSSKLETESLNENKHELYKHVVYLPLSDVTSIEEDTNDLTIKGRKKKWDRWILSE